MVLVSYGCVAQGIYWAPGRGGGVKGLVVNDYIAGPATRRHISAGSKW